VPLPDSYSDDDKAGTDHGEERDSVFSVVERGDEEVGNRCGEDQRAEFDHVAADGRRPYGLCDTFPTEHIHRLAVACCPLTTVM
jgi:hypothetical protein